jgi:hypothetical protein
LDDRVDTASGAADIWLVLPLFVLLFVLLFCRTSRVRTPGGPPMKRTWLVMAFSLTVAGFGAGCGPEEKYCYDQHNTCKQARIDKEEMEKQEEEDRLKRLDALGSPSDGGVIFPG